MTQVHTDCKPQQLLDYLHGEAAKAASTAAVAQDKAREEEDRLLEAARVALGAKHVMRMCSSHEHPSVSRPVQRLIHNAHAVRQAVDLSGQPSSNLGCGTTHAMGEGWKTLSSLGQCGHVLAIEEHGLNMCCLR